MAATKNLEGLGTSTAITCTLTSLGIGSSRQSTAVDNTTNLYLDALVSVLFTIAAGQTASDFVTNVYAYGSEDLTNYASPATGSDGSLGALALPTSLRLIGQIFVSTANSGSERTYVSQPMSVAQAFSGVLPPKWGIVVENRTGLAFSASTGSTIQKCSYTGIYSTSGN